MASRHRFLERVYEVKTDAETRALYDQWAEVYDEDLTENDYRQPARCAETLRLMEDPDDCIVLDVGCGTGLSGLALRGVGFDVIDGCDFSPAMLARAEKSGIYRKLFETNLNEPPIPVTAGAYDGATCVGVFSFGHVRPDALDGILRAVKPGGALVIGLNDRFFRQGDLDSRLDMLETLGRIEIRDREHGEHIPGAGVTGWVISARKLHDGRY